VLGGRAMEIVHEIGQLRRYMRTAVKVSGDNPVLIDSYLEDAIEVDVDARSATAPTSTSPASWSTSRKPASTPAIPPAPCRLHTLPLQVIAPNAPPDPRRWQGRSMSSA
jgi:hypothetical protein